MRAWSRARRGDGSFGAVVPVVFAWVLALAIMAALVVLDEFWTVLFVGEVDLKGAGARGRCCSP